MGSCYVGCPVHIRRKKLRFLLVASVTDTKFAAPWRIFCTGYLQGHLNTFNIWLCIVLGQSPVSCAAFWKLSRSCFVCWLKVKASCMCWVSREVFLLKCCFYLKASRVRLTQEVEESCLYFKRSRSTVSLKQSVTRIKAASLDFAAQSFWCQVMILYNFTGW